jgi:hypothetical protein
VIEEQIAPYLIKMIDNTRGRSESEVFEGSATKRNRGVLKV